MEKEQAALLSRAEAQVGTTLIGKYRLDRVLGIGGMATVFAATHRNQAELAVKVLHPELSLREDLKKRFLREGYVANSVKHSGAVMVLDDAIAEDGSAFLVMELLRGGTLETLREQAPHTLSARVVTAAVIELLPVLTAAHEKSIVHRDLKPGNLFVTTEGTIKVLDFGIARLRDAAASGDNNLTRAGALMGTPGFMAPEQARGMADEIDGQSDLWAVGATMFTLLTGELVHGAGNRAELLIQAGTAKARAVSSVAVGLEPPIAAVIDRALAFDKADRWPTAAAMRGALVAAATQAFGTLATRETLASLASPASPLSIRYTASTEPPDESRPKLP